MAVIQGREDSEVAIKHRWMSMKLLNQMLGKGDTSDSSIAGVALLAGSEVSKIALYPSIAVQHLHEL